MSHVPSRTAGTTSSTCRGSPMKATRLSRSITKAHGSQSMCAALNHGFKWMSADLAVAAFGQQCDGVIERRSLGGDQLLYGSAIVSPVVLAGRTDNHQPAIRIG